MLITPVFGKKLKQTRAFTQSGMQIPVTEIALWPAVVVETKHSPGRGFWGLKMAIGRGNPKTATKPLAGLMKKTGQGNVVPRFLRFVRVTLKDGETLPFKVGDTISATDILEKGQGVKVTGISKGKGFQGGVARHGFAGGPRTHGQSDRERAPGSIGQTTTPGRVYKGKRMAGRTGGTRVTVPSTIIAVDKEKQLIRLKGLIPGAVNSVVSIQPKNMTRE